MLEIDKNTKKKIVWLTADYFIDVDIPIVPKLAIKYDIRWYIIKSKNSNIEISTLDGAKAEIIQLPYSSKNPMLIFTYYKMLRIIKKIQADLIYVDIVGFPFFHPILLQIIGPKNVIHAAHNVLPYNGWPNKKAFSTYIRYVFNNFNNFHLFSKHLLNYFDLKYNNKKTFYAPLSLKNYGDPGIHSNEDDRVEFLFFGNVKLNKRLDLLINAFKALPTEVKSRAMLVIAGQCDNQEYYRQLISNDEHIKADFRRIPDIEIPLLFARSKFLVLPYENVAQSGPHMIAYNYEVPVIATDIQGFSERVIDNETGFLFEVNNSKKLTEVLIKAVMLTEQDYSEMKEKLCEQIKSDFKTEVILDKYESFFDSILDN